jgi:hypothetical protein
MNKTGLVRRRVGMGRLGESGDADLGADGDEDGGIGEGNELAAGGLGQASAGEQVRRPLALVQHRRLGRDWVRHEHFPTYAIDQA